MVCQEAAVFADTWRMEVLDLKRLIIFAVWMMMGGRRCSLCSKGKYGAFVCACVRLHTSVSPYNEVIVYPRPVIGSLAHSIDYSCYLKQLQPGDDFGLIKPWFLLEQPLASDDVNIIDHSKRCAGCWGDF